MEYIRTLEGRGRHYQNARRRFHLGVFLVGFAAGAGVMLLLSAVRP